MKFPFVTKPWPHQMRALRFLLERRGGGLQVPMRWGKTKVGVDFANCLAQLEGIERVLVVTPLSGIGVWEGMVEKETHPDLPMLEWKFVNFESTYQRRKYKKGRGYYQLPRAELVDFDADLVIIDESHHIGNPSTLQSKYICQLGQQARFRVAMTGTMFHRKPFFVFGQAKFYDPAIFGTSFTGFKKMIAEFGGYGGYEVLRYINLEWMMDKMREWVYMEEYVPPGEPLVNPIYFHLSQRGREIYQEMEKESVVSFDDTEVISPIVLTRHLRLQQIAGGWLKTDLGLRRVGNDLWLTALDRMKEYHEQNITKFVVGCRFVAELADAARAAKKAGYRVVLMHGGIPKGEERRRRIRAFQEAPGHVAFICQVQTAKEAIDLSAADTMLFYSLSESFVVHDQFSRRIEKYRDQRRLMFDYLIPRGTRTEVTYEALQQKQDVARYLITHPRQVERITAKEFHS